MATDDELTVDELLEILVEECSEVIQAVCKIQRFGLKRFKEGYGFNDVKLSLEIGDVLGIVDELSAREVLDNDAVDRAQDRKIEKARYMKKKYGKKMTPPVGP